VAQLVEDVADVIEVQLHFVLAVVIQHLLHLHPPRCVTMHKLSLITTANPCLLIIILRKTRESSHVIPCDTVKRTECTTTPSQMHRTTRAIHTGSRRRHARFLGLGGDYGGRGGFVPRRARALVALLVRLAVLLAAFC
jgi:hypothetical protein